MPRMRLMLVNSKQRIAVLASGLVVATSGFVTDEAPSSQPVAPTSAPAQVAADENGPAAASYPKGHVGGGAQWDGSS
jgi:hypothetical protein